MSPRYLLLLITSRITLGFWMILFSFNMRGHGIIKQWDFYVVHGGVEPLTSSKTMWSSCNKLSLISIV
jgi:hypothetical protein